MVSVQMSNVDQMKDVLSYPTCMREMAELEGVVNILHTQCPAEGCVCPCIWIRYICQKSCPLPILNNKTENMDQVWPVLLTESSER